MNNKLYPYMVYDRDYGPTEGAVLIFAQNNKEAKKLAGKECLGWLIENYIDIGVRRLREYEDYLYSLADRGKLQKGEAHIIADPPCCQKCHCWGYPLNENGICIECEGI